MSRPSSAATLAVAVASIVPHLPSVTAGWTQDDFLFVRDNASIRTIPAALAASLDPFPAGDPARGLYRPLTNLSYAFDFALGDGATWPFHISNLVLHAIGAVLLLRLATRYLQASPIAAFGLALLYTLHPIHTEAVDSVTGRSELLVGTLTLGALVLSDRRWGLAATLAALAPFAKESGVMAPVLLFLFEFLKPAASRRLARTGVLVAAVALAWSLARGVATGGFTPAVTLGGTTLFERLATIGTAWATYLRLMLAPTVQHVDLYYEHALGNPPAWSAMAVAGLAGFAAQLALVVLGAVWAIRSRRPAPLAWFGLSLWLFLYLPVSHLVPFGALIGERFLHGPAAGAALLAGVGLARLSPTAGRWLLVGVGLIFTAQTARRSADWRSSIALWSHETRYVEDARAWSNLGGGYLEAGDHDQAQAALEHALELNPLDAPALNNLANLHLRRDELDLADEYARRASAADPTSAPAHHVRGVIALERRRYPEAAGHFREALRVDPNHAPARDHLDRLDANAKAARAFLESPEDGSPHDLLRRASAELALGERDEARLFVARAVMRAGPERWPELRDRSLEEALATP